MIKILRHTPSPMSTMGEMAGICWNADLDKNKCFKRGEECLDSGHHRVSEYADVTIEISEYSARMIRELYTSIIGVSRLQESTRYVDCGKFDYYIPESIENNEDALMFYIDCIGEIRGCYENLLELDIPKQDAANILPLGMFTKVVLKINCRALMHMAEIRMCNRALKEYRDFMQELVKELSGIDEEWKYFCRNYMKPKCEILGYCNESHSCGKYERKGE